ncbi:hypothetical protein GBF38_010521, partial [Nibea albiflora]
LKSNVNTVLVLQECDPEEEATTGVAVGLLLVLEEGVAPTSSAMVRSLAVILEDTIVLDEIPDLPSALAYLLYALNKSYPKTLNIGYTKPSFTKGKEEEVMLRVNMNIRVDVMSNFDHEVCSVVYCGAVFTHTVKTVSNCDIERPADHHEVTVDY